MRRRKRVGDGATTTAVSEWMCVCVCGSRGRDPDTNIVPIPETIIYTSPQRKALSFDNHLLSAAVFLNPCDIFPSDEVLVA